MFSSVAQLCPTLCDPMDSTTPGLPVHHQLPQFTQTHVHWFGDAISSSVAPFSSCPHSFPALGSFPVSQLFTSGGQSIRASISVFLINIQCWFPSGLTGLISLKSKELSRVFFSTTMWKHQFFGTQLSLGSNFPMRTWLLQKPQLWLYGGKNVKDFWYHGNNKKNLDKS